MKGATQSYSGKKVVSKSRQNLHQKTREGANFLAELQPSKRNSHRHSLRTLPRSWVIIYCILEHLLMAASVVNTVEVLKFPLSKKGGLLKRQVDLRNLITSLITSYFSHWNYLLNHTLNKQIFLWYLIKDGSWWKRWIISVKIIEEFRYLGRKAMATQKNIYSGIYISSTWMHRIYCIIETKSKFMPV